MSVDYDLYVKKTILGILESQDASLVDLLKQCHAIFPDELKRILADMRQNKQIEFKGEKFKTSERSKIRRKKLYKNWENNKESALDGIARLKENLHLPHCLDYEWWFATEALERIFKGLLDNHPFELPKSIAFLGGPLPSSFISYFLPETKILILDKSQPTLNAIQKSIPNGNIQTVLYNAEDRLPENLIGSADMVFFDPPWYTEYYDLFMERALQLTYGNHATIGMILFPSYTKPMSLEERKQVMMNAMQMGLNPVRMEQGAVFYEIPLFERNALAQNGLDAGDWRRGDAVFFMTNGKEFPENKDYSLEKFKWDEFVFGKTKVKLKQKPEEGLDYVLPKIIAENPKEMVMASVSRRSPTRDEIDLWTSTHIGLKIQSVCVLKIVLEGMSESKSFPEIISKVQSLFPNEKMVSLVEDIRPVYTALKEVISMENESLQGKKPDHLAILTQPFLDLILSGDKTIETRFAKVACPPFGKVKKDDVVLLKETGGLVKGEFTVGEVEFFDHMTPEKIRALSQFSKEICSDADPAFWDVRLDKKFVTFMHVTNVKRYDKPYSYPKKDRRGWVVLKTDDAPMQKQASLFPDFNADKGSR